MQMITHRRLFVAAVTVTSAALTVLGIGTGALASNAPATGQIKACYKTGATLPPLDHIATTGTCPTGDSSLAWNKVGPQGPAGPTGPQGPAGISTGVSVSSATPVTLDQAQTLIPVLSTPAAPAAGTYYLNASIMLVVAQGDTVTCLASGANGTTGAFTTVGPVANQTYETLPLSQMVTLNAGGSATVSCADYTSNASTSFFDGGITATLINSATGNAPRMSAAHPAHPALPKRL
jgi:hypothetical protein